MALRLYLDASVLVGFLTEDALSTEADRLVGSGDVQPIVSDLVAAEFASAVSRKVRMGKLSKPQPRDAHSDFDIWADRNAGRVDLQSSDIVAATTLLRRLDLSLRTPDAMHVALAMRLDVPLATFDRQLASDAKRLHVPVVGA